MHAVSGSVSRCSGFVLGLFLVAFGCGGDRDAPPGPPLVIATIAPLATFVERLAGDRVAVETLLPPGANPHTYEPTMTQMLLAGRARLLVEVGHPALPFERVWRERLTRGRSDLAVVNASRDLVVDGEEGHVWLSPADAPAMAATLALALEAELPGATPAIEANLAAFLRETEALDAELHTLLDPYRGRAFLVYHPAWGALAREFGLEQVAIERHGKPPSPDDLVRLIARGRREGIRTVFVQPQAPRRGAQAVAAELGATLVVLDPLAPDWAENLRRTARLLAEGFSP